MDINRELKSISKQHKKHFKEFTKKAEANASTIFNILQAHSSYQISRIKILSTIGIKSTCERVNHPDFNLVVFVNYEAHQFKDVLENLEECLIRSGSSHTEFIMDWRTHSSIYFQMKDVTYSEELPSRTVSYITFELLPTMNFLSPTEEKLTVTVENKEEKQGERALHFISQLPKESRNLISYNTSVAERYVAFVESQSRFVHRVICLAKLWNRMVFWSGVQRLYSRSIFIELVAISVAVEEEKNVKKLSRGESLFHAFDAFLTKFADFDTSMKEVFKYTKNDDLVLDRPYQKYVDQTLSSDKNRPLILDPVNPFNNLATHFPSYMKIAFKSYAKATRRKLMNLAFQSRNLIQEKHELEPCFGI